MDIGRNLAGGKIIKEITMKKSVKKMAGNRFSKSIIDPGFFFLFFFPVFALCFPKQGEELRETLFFPEVLSFSNEIAF